MNKKAESFKNFIDEKHPNIFDVEEIPNDEQNTTVFRSSITIAGQRLLAMVIIDDSIFTILRVQILPQAVTEENQTALLDLINEQNKGYKPFKLYLNDNKDLMLDTCLTVTTDELDGEVVYTLFDVIITYLNNSYRKIMKVVW